MTLTFDPTILAPGKPVVQLEAIRLRVRDAHDDLARIEGALNRAIFELAGAAEISNADLDAFFAQLEEAGERERAVS